MLEFRDRLIFKAELERIGFPCGRFMGCGASAPSKYDFLKEVRR